MATTQPATKGAQQQSKAPITDAERKQAADVVKKAKVQLTINHPFFAQIVLHRKIEIADRVSTAYITQRGRIVVGTRFAASLKVQQMVFLLAHEAMHYAMLHMLRRKHRDMKKWNVACDAVINDLLETAKVGEAIEHGVRISGSKDKTSEKVYDELPDQGGAGNGGAVGAGGTIGAGGSGTGGSGTGGTGGKPPFVPTGPALTAPDGTWTWIDVAGTKCRDGSASGLAVSLKSASKKVMVYLEGGGACFNSTTCGLNPANSTGQHGAQTAGLFDRTNAKNPVKDWNFVYIPYCTGDVHVGTNDAGTVAGVTGTQHFVGRLNMEKYLNRIVPTFPGATQVLLTGISAGGFGAAGNADFVAWAFGSGPKFNLIDDSGPPMSSDYVPTCMQDAWRTTWGLDGSMLKDCGGSCTKNNDYLIDYSKFLATKYSANYSGVIDAQADGIISLFYGFGYDGGAKDCNGSILTAMPGATFKAGLLDFRSKMSSFSKFGTYFPTGTQHTWLGGASLYTGSAGGTALIDWVTAIVNNTGTSNAGN